MSDVTKATLAELLILEVETGKLGRALNLSELESMQATLEAIEDDEVRGRHPDALWMLGATVYLARRRAGERISFETAVDFPVDEVEWIVEPGDEPAKTADPTQARPDFGRAAKPAGSGPKSNRSKSRSTGA